MLVELVSISNEEGLVLDGAYFAPAPDAEPAQAVDALLLIHGSRGNFNDATTKEMAEDLRNLGYACLALNTNAHDNIWISAGDNGYYGNAYEILHRTCLDLRAGIDYLWDAGHRRIGLLGHSMGAVRVAYYAATQADERVATVIPVSPVRLSHRYYLLSQDAEEFLDIISRAQALEAAGKGDELLQVDFPIQQYFSATSYLDKHGPGERYNLVDLAANIKIPLLAISGSLETHTRLKDMARDLAEAAIESPKAEYVIIDGGQHSLGNMKKECSTTVSRWLAALAPLRVQV